MEADTPELVLKERRARSVDRQSQSIDILCSPARDLETRRGRSAKPMTGFTISSAWRTLDATPVDWAQAEELAG